MGDKSAAASLTLAGVLSRPTPEPIIVESDDRHPLGAKEAAMRLNRGSAKIYDMCLSGRLRCRKMGRVIRIPIDAIERHETETPPATVLVPRNEK
jgi:excisionase family DNA binding protein